MDKVSESYYCEHCDYLTINRYDYNKHCKRQKHFKNIAKTSSSSSQNPTHIAIIKQSYPFCGVNTKQYECDYCYKKYKFSSGLSRHKQKCEQYKNALQQETSHKIIEKQSQHIHNLHALIEQTIEKQNTTIHQLVEKLTTPIAHHTSNVTNNYNNMTINVYLNQYCKDAMNLSDFISSLKLSMEDLEYTIDNGYVKGITNIFMKRLTDLAPTQRPIHCSDANRLLFHVKDDNSWEEDDKHERIDKSIDTISQKQIQMIKDWEKKNPQWNQSDEGTECYMNMVREMMGGINEREKVSKYEIIKKELGLSVDINAIL